MLAFFFLSHISQEVDFLLKKIESPKNFLGLRLLAFSFSSK